MLIECMRFAILLFVHPDGRIPQSKDKAILYKKLPRRRDNLVAAVVVETGAGGIVEVITVLVHFEVKR
ncbi:MAG: hypothetical protein A2289_00595 [Deltaproteobacteria bacterium RIFOXYA12_FULL_58_15]|nr:MAG: hypothetical protein A2289_00595 [Deltaproteobacteria bacterium RIFOXYA12_FULL_58_15]OGR08545.1 MAG: hypothetical protein A2341_25385 [Deltaproteobacteria bacterium RIFOXYB12_FULL_58_9]